MFLHLVVPKKSTVTSANNITEKEKVQHEISRIQREILHCAAGFSHINPVAMTAYADEQIARPAE